MPISTIDSNGLTNPLTSGVTTNTITSAASTALTLKSAGTTAVTIDTSQRVGIGTASPSALLHVSSTSAETLRFQSTSSAPYQTFYNSSANRAGYMEWNTSALKIDAESGASSTMTFLTANNERMRIDSSGVVRINNTSNATFAAQLNIYSPNSLNCAIHCRTNTSATQSQIIFGNSTNDAVGSIVTTSSSTAYQTSSDYRLKENIQPMQNALAKVSALKPVTYNWKVDGADGQGFIAHELQEVVPDCVTGDKDAVDADGNPVYQGVDTSFLVATLTAAIQEQQALITAQAETINALTARIEALENK